MAHRADTDTDENIPTGYRTTSVESKEILADKKNDYRRKIYYAILQHGGMTCDEVEVALNIRHQTASCFIRFLTQDGWLYEKRRPNGEIETRKTRSGRSAIVWAARLNPIVRTNIDQKELF